MSSKLGLLSLCLLAMVGVAPSVLCAEAAPAQGSPSISQLETFAGASAVNPADVNARLAEARKQLAAGQPFAAQEVLNRVINQKMTPQQESDFVALKKKVDDAVAAQQAKVAQAGPTAGGTIQEQTRRVMEQARQRAAIQQQAHQAKAAELVKEGRYLLFTEGNAQKAYDLAKQAVELDPSSKDAQDLLTDAGVKLGDKGAEFRLQGGLAGNLAGLRLQSYRQTFNNSLSKARQSYADGQYEQALKELRSSEFYVGQLAATQDVSAERREVENLKEQVQQDYAEAERRAATSRTTEAAAQAAASQNQMEEIAGKRDARLVDSIMRMIDDKQFAEARRVIDNLELANPSDSLVPYLRKKLSEAGYYDTVAKQNAARDRGDLVFKMWSNDEELIPEQMFEYPDKTFWKQVAEKRQPVEYPSQVIRAGESAADQAVREQLNQVVPMQFDQTSLPEAADFLRQVTRLNIVVLPSATQQNPAPITLQLDNTSLKSGLDQICAMTDTAWKLEDGIIKIGSVEALRKYEMRIYIVRDLLVSTEDTGTGNLGNSGGGGGALGNTGTSRGGTTYGGGSNTNRGGGLSGSFPAESGQFGVGGNSGGGGSSSFGGGGGGAFGGGSSGNNNNVNVLAYRAQDLILLIKQSCGEGTWLDPYGSGVIYSAQSSTSGTAGGGFGGIGGGGRTAGGFGAPGAGAAAGGFGGAAGGFGFPGGAGFGAAGTTGAAGTAAQLPQGQAFVLGSDAGSIVIVQTAEVHDCIEKLLKGLRATRKIQVHVDVRFLTVTSNFLREVGFQWNDFTLDANAFNGPFNTLSGFTAAGSSVGIGQFVVPDLSSVVFVPDPANPGTGTFQGVPLGYNPLGVTFTNPIPAVDVDPDTGLVTYDQNFTSGSPVVGTGIPFFPEGSSTGLNLNLGYGSDEVNLTGLFRLANSRDELRTVHAPQITLANGQQGFLSVSTDFDYISGYSVSNNTLTPNTSTVSDIIELSVRPVVSADRRYVFMELYPVIQQTDLSNRANFTTFTGQPGGGGTTGGGAAGVAVTNFITLPKITQQSFATTVGVPDRGLVIVGGLSHVERDQHEAGVPILDKIPILKRLFSAEGRKIDRDTLFIMAKPQIQILDELEHQMD